MKRELCSCWREWERLFFAGSGIQCSCLHFLLLWIKDWTELEQRQRWRLRRHCTPFSRPPRPASTRLTSPPSALRLFAFGISKWNDCFAIVIQRVLILLGGNTSPLFYTLLLEPSQLDFSAHGYDEKNCKCGKLLVSHFDITVHMNLSWNCFIPTV